MTKHFYFDKVVNGVAIYRLEPSYKAPGKSRMAFTILEAEARTKATHPVTTYSDIFDLGDYDFLQIIQDIVSSATDAGDTLDCVVEFSSDGTKWWNGGTFTQQAGDGAARREVMTFKNSLAVDPDAIFTFAVGAGIVNEKLFGRYMRVGVGVSDNDTNGSHVFSVTGYIGGGSGVNS
jgi:hypothetical protein